MDQKHDHISDPARADQVGNDWTTEGGAMPSGPAIDDTADDTDGADDTADADDQAAADAGEDDS